MGLFSRPLNGQVLQQLENMAIFTVFGYISRARAGVGPEDKIPALGSVGLEDLTQGTVTAYLFGNKVDASQSAASEAVKAQFEREVLPFLPRLANEAVHRDEDMAKLSFNNLDLKAAFLEQHHGSSWKTTEVGARVADALKKVFDHEHDNKTVSVFKYRSMVYMTHAKYEATASTVDWDTVFSIKSYA